MSAREHPAILFLLETRNTDMNLRALQCFVILAEELNFSRAAERLHIAQPALSQQIRSLEERLGTQLVDGPMRCATCAFTSASAGNR
jgi:hypothetical protein